MLSLHVFMFVNIFQVFLYINKYSQSVSVWLLAINVFCVILCIINILNILVTVQLLLLVFI